MFTRPMTYFLGFSLAAHAALLGLWPDSDMKASRQKDSSIEIGLVMLPTLEKDFRQERVQAHEPALARTPPVEPLPEAVPEPSRAPVEMTDSAAIPVMEEKSVETTKQFISKKTGETEKPAEPVMRSADAGSSPATATRAAPLHAENPAPVYPAKALRYGWEGDVWLKVDVNRNGFVDTISVDRSSGYPVLDRAAIRTVRKWLFEPARIGPEPTDGSVRVPVRFKIKRT